MSQFDRYTTTEYVEGMRLFLGVRKKAFLAENGFLQENQVVRRGRLPKYSQEPIAELERKVNAKAALAETIEATLAQRISIARDYAGKTDAKLARELQVSRETVRRWAENLSKPVAADLPRLAEALNVPVLWLKEGGEDLLPANSAIGVRVGEEAAQAREAMYGLTLAEIGKLPEDASLVFIQAHLEWAVVNKPEMAKHARRAGGRWQVAETTYLIQDPLVFAPWQPIPEHGLAKRMWSDEVEAIIKEELLRNKSIYAAWQALCDRSEEMGLSADEYPKKISLYKRVEHDRERVAKFGVNMNEILFQSVTAAYSQ